MSRIGGAFAAALVVLAGASGVARADEATARGAFEAAERANEELRFADALARYRDAARMDPSAPFASVATARARYLEARSEADFEPLAALERARRDPTRLAFADRVDAFDRAANRFPHGAVRAEALVVAGEAWLHLHRRYAAEAALAKAAAEPHADDLTRGVALSDLVGSLRSHDESAALVALDTYPNALPALRADVARAILRERLALAAMGVLGAFVVAAILAAVRVAIASGVGALRAAVSASSIAVALYVGGAGALIASLRSDGDPRPFLLLGAGLAVVVVASRALAIAAPSSPRIARAAAAACAALATAFLAVVGTDAGYLASLGL